MSKPVLENTETNMVAFVDGYVLTQTELCNKLRPVVQEFALLRQTQRKESQEKFSRSLRRAVNG
jgi:hypothetical protein